MAAGEAPLREVLRHASTRLAAAGVDRPGVDATILLAHVLEVEASELHKRVLLGHTLPAAAAERFAPLLDRRCAREPLQHLTGRAPFRRLDLAVGPGVFVPRPETEIVAGLAVTEAARLVEAGETPIVVDLCAGSGAIAVSVADEVSAADVHAVELSDEALVWARANIAQLGSRVTLHADDVTGALDRLASLRGRVAAVVSNPPYIPADARPVDVEVAEHDPEMALYGGGEDGLHVPRAVVDAAARLLRPGGLFVMEHAEVQSETLVALLDADGRWTDVAAEADLTGRPRAVRARRSTNSGARLLDCDS